MALYLLVISLALGIAASLEISGSVDREENMYVFPGSAMIDEKYVAQISYEMKVPTTHDGITLAVYNASTVNYIYDNSMSCQAKIDKAYYVLHVATCVIEASSYESAVHKCYGDFWLQGLPYTEFHFVLFNCYKQNGIKVKSYYLSDMGKDYPKTNSASTQFYSTLGLILAAVVTFM